MCFVVHVSHLRKQALHVTAHDISHEPTKGKPIAEQLWLRSHHIRSTEAPLVPAGCLAIRVRTAYPDHACLRYLKPEAWPPKSPDLNNTSKTPCLAMNERARKIKSVFFLCGFSARAQRFPRQRNWTRTCECGHPTSDSCKSRNYWVSSHTWNFSTIGHSILRYGDGGARAHVQRCPTPPMTCGKHVLSDLQPTCQIWTQSVKPFLRYRSTMCTCARAEIPHPWIVLST